MSRTMPITFIIKQEQVDQKSDILLSLIYWIMLFSLPLLDLFMYCRIVNLCFMHLFVSYQSEGSTVIDGRCNFAYCNQWRKY